MIDKVGLNLNTSHKNNFQHNNQGKNKQFDEQIKYEEHLHPQLLKNYYVPIFTGKENQKPMMSKKENIKFYMSTPAKTMFSKLQQSAMETGYSEVTVLHVMKYATEEALEYFDDLDHEKIDFDVESQPSLASIISYESTPHAFSKPENRKKLKPVLEKQLEKVNSLIENNKPDSSKNVNVNDIKMSDDLINSVFGLAADEKISTVSPYLLVSGAYNSPVKEIANHTNQFLMDVDSALMLEKTPINKRTTFSAYEQKLQMF